VAGVVIGPGEGEVFDRGDRVVTIKCDLGTVSVHEVSFESSFSVPPHSHDDHVDAFYVLEGEVEFHLDGEVVHAAPGTFFAAPPGTVHGFSTPGPGRARLLNLHAPDAGFADSVRGE
jgi:quercetin dioxygenase-like cupin family protein